MERVLLTVDAGVAHVRLNRADKRNGLDFAMFEALIATGERIASDRSIRAVVLSGEGPAFCAGLDWNAFLADRESQQKLLARDLARSPANVAQRACWIWTEVPVPVIAAVHGAALGGGLQLALACDVRVVAPDAQLSVMEIRYGLVPDMTASQTLLRLVRPDIAKDLVFTGRVVTGEEAVRIGLATRVAADPLADAMAIATTIAAQSPHAIRAGKLLLDRAPAMSVNEALEFETELQVGLLGTPNQVEAVQAAMTKRAGRFSDQ
ncbi:MAG TPA: crotonase/enoyl-CoA hydratase family protein [Kofleriaceae bacterium]|jgi:enoyl-CoA hydratase/carnithine racemase